MPSQFFTAPVLPAEKLIMKFQQKKLNTPSKAMTAVNKDPFEEKALVLHPGIDGAYSWRQITVWGESTESYNDIGHTEVELKEGEWREGNGSLSVSLKAHSVHVIQIRKN